MQVCDGACMVGLYMFLQLQQLYLFSIGQCPCLLEVCEQPHQFLDIALEVAPIAKAMDCYTIDFAISLSAVNQSLKIYP